VGSLIGAWHTHMSERESRLSDSQRLFRASAVNTVSASGPIAFTTPARCAINATVDVAGFPPFVRILTTH